MLKLKTVKKLEPRVKDLSTSKTLFFILIQLSLWLLLDSSRTHISNKNQTILKETIKKEHSILDHLMMITTKIMMKMKTMMKKKTIIKRRKLNIELNFYKELYNVFDQLIFI